MLMGAGRGSLINTTSVSLPTASHANIRATDSRLLFFVTVTVTVPVPLRLLLLLSLLSFTSTTTIAQIQFLVPILIGVNLDLGLDPVVTR